MEKTEKTEKMEKKELVVLSTRVPKRLKDAILQYIQLDFHKNISDFVIDALREKLERDAPHIVKRFLEEGK